MTIDAGTIIDGRYEVLRRVGSGGMADVYLASDRLLGRQVALKLLHHRFAEDQEFVERFKREASSAAGLSHPNVVSIFDRGEWDGTYYIAMEYLPGRTLKAIVREQGPLPLAAAIDVVVQVLRAARFAHRRGVIHRDLKPQNVILDEEGRAKVTDFGIARAGASDMTLTGSIMGTAQYLSPEQAQGHQVSEASDLYAIGIVLYELLTSRVPFEGETAVTIALQHISRQPPPPSSLNPAVPPPLDAVVLKALQKDPSLRYHSAEEAIAALEAVRSTLPAPRGEHALPGTPRAFVGNADDGVRSAADAPTDRVGGPAWMAGADAGAAAAGAAFAGPGRDPAPATAVQGAPPAAAPWQPPTGQLAAYDPGRGPGSSAATGAWQPDEAAPSSRRRRWWLLAAAAVVVALIAAALIVLLLPSSKVTVPSLIGDQASVAVARLHGLGLRPERTAAASASVPAGRVVSQAPGGGQLVKPHSKVTIVVSTGVGESTVPKVAGLIEEKALAQLRAADLRAEVRRQSSEAVGSGLAIATEPAAGKHLPAGSEVVLLVSSGPAQVRVPNVVGQSRTKAEERLEGAGLSIGTVTEVHREGVRAGSVVSQTPRAGGKTATGTSVSLVVAKAAPSQTTVVPSVIEDGRESALATLRAAGLKPQTVSEVVSNAAQVGFVTKQSPQAGASVHRGSTVKVYVGVQETQTTSSSVTSSQTSSQTTSQTSTTKPAQAAGG